LTLRFEEENYTNINEYDQACWVQCMVLGRMRWLTAMKNLETSEIPWVLLFGWEADLPDWLMRCGGHQEQGVKLPAGDADCDFSDYRLIDVLPSSLVGLRVRDDVGRMQRYGYTNRTDVGLVEQLMNARLLSFPALSEK
jgi:hypothetical protein